MNNTNNVIKFEKHQKSLDETISIAEAAKLLGKGYSTAYKWIVLDKKIPYYDYGWSKAVSRKDVEDFRNSKLVSKGLKWQTNK